MDKHEIGTESGGGRRAGRGPGRGPVLGNTTKKRPMPDEGAYPKMTTEAGRVQPGRASVKLELTKQCLDGEDQQVGQEIDEEDRVDDAEEQGGDNGIDEVGDDLADREPESKPDWQVVQEVGSTRMIGAGPVEPVGECRVGNFTGGAIGTANRILGSECSVPSSITGYAQCVGSMNGSSVVGENDEMKRTRWKERDGKNERKWTNEKNESPAVREGTEGLSRGVRRFQIVEGAYAKYP